MSAFRSKKPYSAVTVAIENLTSERFEEDDFSGIPDLVESINLQASGPTEAARAIRKKLKYGNIHRQLRALTILDGLIQNSGASFHRVFADEMLLERLRFCGTSDLSDPLVRTKCKELFGSWAKYRNTRGLEKIAVLYKQTHTKSVVTRDQSKVVRETENPFGEDEAEEEEEKPKPSHSHNTSLSQTDTHSTGSSSHSRPSFFSPSPTVSASSKSKKDKKSGKKKKSFNLEAEKETMKACIAESSMASTNLLNALRSINREREQISENAGAVNNFENCKILRRKILRYIQFVESEQYLGALLHANDELVVALMTFEQLDRSVDADSDSEDEMAEQRHVYKLLSDKGKSSANDDSSASNQLAGLHISPPKSKSPEARPPPPRRPAAAPSAPVDTDEEEDENDPFADSNALQTPAAEKDEPKWAVI